MTDERRPAHDALTMAFSCEATGDGVLFGPSFHHDAGSRAGEFTVSGWTIVAGVQLEMVERGRGRPILWLHGEEGLDPEAPVLDALADHGRVLAPSHPGYGHSPEAADVDTIDDLAYLYLDWLAELDARDAVLVGCSLGGWIA